MATPITNDNATTDVPNGYEIDDRTGFRAYPGELVRDGHIDGLYVSKKARDERHPAEDIRSVQDRQYGPQSPEVDDRFLADNEVTIDDL